MRPRAFQRSPLHSLSRAAGAAALAALLAGAVACSSHEADAASKGEAKGAEGAKGGRGAQSVVLSASDVGVVRRDTVEDAVALSGDLLPIEHVDMKAKLEGDLDAVLVREGDRVAQGQLMARFEASAQESERARAEADRAAARSALATAQWDATQSAELFKAGAIPERDYRTTQEAVQTARARLAAAESRLRSTSIVATDTRVVAPTTGVVEQRLVEPGERVSRGATMFTVVRSDVLELEAAVPARQAGGIRPGQKVHFVADGRPFEGTVARVSPSVDRASRSVPVYVRVPNASGSLKANSFATGRVVGRTAAGVLTVPTSALRQRAEDGAPFVYRIVGQQLAATPVTLGIVDEARGLAEVVSGLSEHDRVVAGNVGTLGNGMAVTVLGEGSANGAPAGKGAATATAATPSPR